MPAPERGGRHDVQRRPPRLDPTGQEHQQGAIGPGAARPFDAAAQDAELVAEEGILGHQRRLAARQVGEGADNEGRGGRARGCQQPLVKAARGGVAERD